MKKLVFIIGGIIIVAGIVIGAVLLLHKSDNKSTGKTNQSSSSTSTAAAPTNTDSYKDVEACKTFTLPDAKVLLGGDVKAGAGNGVGDASSGDIDVSTCSYSSVSSGKTVTVLARSAKTAAGAESNASVFGVNKPVGKQDVSGIGDKAFWDPPLSQLDVLKGNNWYIIGNITGTHADSGTLETSQAVYNQIRDKL
ncbi:MAG TPA: hypothetical protein VLH38_04735 [Patescibacteria group bacterium]|nr:hypothetical protein [Patescibacteria group bacterium]